MDTEERRNRQQKISELKAFRDDIEKEVTLLLQILRWDKNKIIEMQAMVVCKHDAKHRIPLKDRDIHETQCHLARLGYTKDDKFLPDPVDLTANTLVKFSKQDIANIIESAAVNDSLFKRAKIVCKLSAKKCYSQCVRCVGPEPLTVECLQRAYSADERRAIHDAVVNAAPFCHDLTDLELLSSNDDAKTTQKSRLEILAELRNMRRRRTKYRVAPKTRNYSHVLRDLIQTQMESPGEATGTVINTEHESNIDMNTSSEISEMHHVEQERMSTEEHTSYRYAGENSNERRRGRSRKTGYDDTKRGYRRSGKRIDNVDEIDYYENRSKDRSRKHEKSHRDDKSIDYGKDRSRNSERCDDRRKHSRDKYPSKYKSDNCKDRSRTDVIVKQERVSPDEWDMRHRDSVKSRTKYSWEGRDGNYYDEQFNPYQAIKQERELPETYESSRNGQGSRRSETDLIVKQERVSPDEWDMRHRDSVKSRTKYSWEGRDGKYDERFNTNQAIKQERESPEIYESSRNGQGSRKRGRSSSGERRHRDRNKSDKERHSPKRSKYYDSRHTDRYYYQ